MVNMKILCRVHGHAMAQRYKARDMVVPVVSERPLLSYLVIRLRWRNKTVLSLNVNPAVYTQVRDVMSG